MTPQRHRTRTRQKQGERHTTHDARNAASRAAHGMLRVRAPSRQTLVRKTSLSNPCAQAGRASENQPVPEMQEPREEATQPDLGIASEDTSRDSTTIIHGYAYASGPSGPIHHGSTVTRAGVSSVGVTRRVRALRDESGRTEDVDTVSARPGDEWGSGTLAARSLTTALVCYSLNANDCRAGNETSTAGLAAQARVTHASRTPRRPRMAGFSTQTAAISENVAVPRLSSRAADLAPPSH